jgi:hypothetical protein
MSNQNLTDIVGFLKAQRTAQSDRRPLDRPPIIDDETANPTKKAAAEQAYTAALLNRPSLTPDETAWLGKQIVRHLKNPE